MEKIESKINTYQDIRLDKQTASRFVTVLATFFSIGFVVLLFDLLGLVTTVLHNQPQLGGNLQLIGFILLFCAPGTTNFSPERRENIPKRRAFHCCKLIRSN